MQVRCGIAHVKQWQQASSVPSGTRCQLVAFQQHNILPTVFRKVIGDARSNGTTTDDQSFYMSFHFRISADLIGVRIAENTADALGVPTVSSKKRLLPEKRQCVLLALDKQTKGP